VFVVWLREGEDWHKPLQQTAQVSGVRLQLCVGWWGGRYVCVGRGGLGRGSGTDHCSTLRAVVCRLNRGWGGGWCSCVCWTRSLCVLGLFWGGEPGTIVAAANCKGWVGKS